MELRQAVRARSMVRSFRPDALADGTVDDLCDIARRAPSAGNTQACEFLVLDSEAAVGRYWDVTLPEPRRSGFRWPGLLLAPVLVVVVVRPNSYVERYSEPDKARTGLGEGVERWSVPYWWVDAGAVAQNLLLAAVDASLGACLFGLFEHEAAVARQFNIPSDRRLVATIAIGHRSDDDIERGRSAQRARSPLGEVLHRGHW